MNVIRAISQMKQLKILEFCNVDGLTDEHIPELASGLGPRLERMQLEGSTGKNLTVNGLKMMLPYTKKLSNLIIGESKNLMIDEKDFEEMVEVLQRRPERIRLLMNLTENRRQVHVNVATQRANCDVFYIEQKIRCNHNADWKFPLMQCKFEACFWESMPMRMLLKL